MSTTATSGKPRRVSASLAQSVLLMPPSAPSPTSSAGRRKGRRTSHLVG